MKTKSKNTVRRGSQSGDTFTLPCMVPRSVHEALIRQAREAGKTVDELVIALIERWLSTRRSTAKA